MQDVTDVTTKQIQIQLLLKLNEAEKVFRWVVNPYSNTTLVKVKLLVDGYNESIPQYSNTTLVKVK